MAFGRRNEESFRLDIDISEYNNLKVEIADLLADVRIATANAHAAADKLKAVNRDLNVTLEKILAAKRK